MLTMVARTVDLLALAFAFGSTAWFFFVQSPVLVKRMGRDRFVPLQMSLALVLFRSLSVVLLIMLGASISQSASLFSLPVCTAALALVGAVLNGALVVPRALKAGGRSLREEQTVQQQKSVARFVSEGGGEATRFWHRAVVFFVVVMLAGLLPHAASLVSAQTRPAEPAAANESGEGHGVGAMHLNAGRRWKATPETTEGVHAMLSVAQQAATNMQPTSEQLQGTVHQLTDALQDIFRRCRMTGPAHEQLHLFLAPVGELLARLEASKGAAVGGTLEQLRAHLGEYDTYFE